MRFIVGDRELFSRTFNDWDELSDAYAEDTARAGKAVPDYALETLLGLLAAWLFEKAADAAVDWIATKYRERKNENRSDEAKWVDLLNYARESGAKIQIVLSTDTERDLAPAIEKLAAANNVKVEIARG